MSAGLLQPAPGVFQKAGIIGDIPVDSILVKCQQQISLAVKFSHFDLIAGTAELSIPDRRPGPTVAHIRLE